MQGLKFFLDLDGLGAGPPAVLPILQSNIGVEQELFLLTLQRVASCSVTGSLCLHSVSGKEAIFSCLSYYSACLPLLVVC